MNTGHRITLAPGGLAFSCGAEETLLQALQRVGVAPDLLAAIPGRGPGTPLKRLAYFEKACAANTLVQYTVGDADVSHWDVGAKAWALTTGTWGVLVGSSSLDIRLQGTLVVS